MEQPKTETRELAKLESYEDDHVTVTRVETTTFPPETRPRCRSTLTEVTHYRGTRADPKGRVEVLQYRCESAADHKEGPHHGNFAVDVNGLGIATALRTWTGDHEIFQREM